MKAVLFVASNPTATKFEFAEELRRIEQVQEHWPGTYRVRARWSVSLSDLQRLIEQFRPNILHLLSPGVEPKTQGLMLSDHEGKPQYVRPDALAEVFARRRKTAPELVVLNTCHSLQHAEALAPHVGAVVAMKGLIFDHAAIAFATEFYQDLAGGASVAAAFERGRAAVKQLTPEQENTPVLLAGTADPAGIRIAQRKRKVRGSRGAELTPQESQESATPAAKPACVRVFCSYSHKDEKYRAELETHLALLSQQGSIHVWHDRRIQPGMEWAREIDGNLDHAQIILMLVSADFLASRYCFGIELKRALERQKKEGIRVVPILVRKCDLVGAPFSGLQWLPTGSKPVKNWSDRDAAWTDVATGIRETVKELVANGQASPAGPTR